MTCDGTAVGEGREAPLEEEEGGKPWCSEALTNTSLETGKILE